MATGALDDDDAEREVRADFGDAVNMTPAQLRAWLDTARGPTPVRGRRPRVAPRP